MTTPIRRTKMITFRVSREEYEQLRVACRRQGIRSVSAFAREAVETLMNGPVDTTVGQDILELRNQIQALAQRVDEMARNSHGLGRDSGSSPRGLPA